MVTDEAPPPDEVKVGEKGWSMILKKIELHSGSPTFSNTPEPYMMMELSDAIHYNLVSHLLSLEDHYLSQAKKGQDGATKICYDKDWESALKKTLEDQKQRLIMDLKATASEENWTVKEVTLTQRDSGGIRSHGVNVKLEREKEGTHSEAFCSPQLTFEFGKKYHGTASFWFISPFRNERPID